MQTFNFNGLEGVKGTLKGPIVRTRSAAAVGLLNFRIVSAAGDYGAVNLYRDDSKTLRGERCEYQRTVESQTFKTKKAALEWFDKQMRICRNGHSGVAC